MANAKSMIETVTSVFNSIETRLENMPDKGRVQIKELTKAVSTELKLDPKDILGFVTYFARNTDQGYVSRGKNGGLIKGTRPTKPTPSANKSSDSDNESDDDSTEDSDQ